MKWPDDTGQLKIRNVDGRTIIKRISRTRLALQLDMDRVTLDPTSAQQARGSSTESRGTENQVQDAREASEGKVERLRLHGDLETHSPQLSLGGPVLEAF